MPNIADALRAHMTYSLLELAQQIGQAATDAGVHAYLVGGSVRDTLMGKTDTLDLDITLLGARQATFEAIAATLGAQIRSHSQFTTATLRIRNTNIDLAMTRAEGYPRPGSLPIVQPGTLKHDLERRDFSINAIAVSLAKDDFGELHDPCGGIQDISQRNLRILNANSFRDDATRILRAARYTARLSLRPTADTLDALKESLSYTSTISSARMRNELERVFTETTACADAMRLLHQWGALSAIHPSLAYNEDAWRRLCAASESPSQTARVGISYAILGAGIRPDAVSSVVARLSPSSLHSQILAESSAIISKLTGVQSVSSSIGQMPNSALADMLDPLHEYTIIGCALVLDGAARTRLGHYIGSLRSIRPALTGRELIAMGVPRGPVVGRILAELRRANLDGYITNAAEERVLAQQLARRGQVL